MFYTPQDALSYLKGKVASLFAARGVLQDAYGRALIARSKAQTPELVAKADQLVSDLTVSLQDQSSLESKVKMIVPAEWVPQNLGLFPLIIGAGAVAVAGAVYLHLEKVSEYKQTLDLVERGILTPSQAGARLVASSGGVFSGLTGALTGAAVLYGLFLFGPSLSKMLRR